MTPTKRSPLQRLRSVTQSDDTTITSYHGNIEPVSYHGVDAYRLIPKSSGHLRVHTVKMFQFPFRATWWMRPYADMRPNGTNGGERMDGLHVLFGHQDNDVNYNMHCVRRDGNAKLDLEYGLLNYTNVAWWNDKGLPLRFWRRYLFTLEVTMLHNTYTNGETKHVALKVRSDDKNDSTINLKTLLPENGPEAGHLGFRLDNLSVLFGGLTVREL